MTERANRDTGMTAPSIGGFDGLQRRRRVLGFPIAVIYKFFDDQGSYLAALITYYGFVSLFPLLLLLVTILGFVLHGDPTLRAKVLNSAFGQLPQIGDDLRNQVNGLSGSPVGLIVGIVGSLYGGLGVAQAAQNAMNKVWAVPRNSRPNPFKARGRSLLLLGLLGSGVIVTTGLSVISTFASDVGLRFDGALAVVPPIVTVAANMGLFLVAFRLLTVRRLTIRQLMPGAFLAALGFKGLQVLGQVYLVHVAARSNDTYGTFAIVLGLIAWLFLVSVVLVLCAEINAVRVGRLWPRALLTPFTDDVVLTPADRRAYTMYSQTERYKGYQRIDVHFPGVDELEDPPADVPPPSPTAEPTTELPPPA